MGKSAYQSITQRHMQAGKDPISDATEMARQTRYRLSWAEATVLRIRFWRGSEGRNRCRPVDIAIERAQRVIFHFLSSSLPLVLLRTTLPRLENILSSTSTSSPSPFRNPSIRWQQGRGPSTRILAPFREEERAILLPCLRRR